VQLAYAIGTVEPVSFLVDTHGTGVLPDEALEQAAREVFPLTPRGIIEALDLRRPIYAPTSAYGHFGARGTSGAWKVIQPRREMMVRPIWVPAGLVLLFLLNGCGGGGGGGESGRSLMTITSENSPTVATAAWGALASGDILFDDDLLPLQAMGTEAEESAAVRQLSILRGVTATTLGYLEWSETLVPLAAPGDPALSPQATETFPCSISGSIVISETDATSGFAEFRDCTVFEEGVYVRLNGRVELSNVQFSEGPCIDRFSASIRFRDVSASIYETLGGPLREKVAINGSANASAVDDFCGGVYSLRLDGRSLTLRTLSESIGYFNFDIRGTDAGSYWEDDIRVTLDVGSLPGSITVTTPQPLRGFWYETYPYEGQVRLAGAGGGYLLATVNASAGPAAVSIVGDFNNDGALDCVAEVSWQQIVDGSWSCGTP
jgi:hypothetical protein